MSDGPAWDTSALDTTGRLNLTPSAIPEPATCYVTTLPLLDHYSATNNKRLH